MDFLDLVLKGYTNKNNREFLDKYFYREFKKAEKEHYFEPEEFFKGCFDIVESFKEELQNKVWERKQELLMMLERARNKTIKYADLQGKTIVEKRKETIEYCENELASETTYSIGSIGFTVHLMSRTNGRFLGSLYNHEVEFIETSIIKAKIRVLKEIFKTLETSQQKTIDKESEISLKEKTADWRFFQIEVNADIKVDGKIYKNVKQKNNDSILNPDNWNQHKETFFNQRMDKYKKNYTNEEKIKLELETLDKLTINKTDYKIIKDRYNLYLQDILDSNNSEYKTTTESNYDKAIRLLNEIWLPNAKLSVEDFLQKGIKKGIWNDQLTLMTQRGSMYGTGKTTLACFFVSLKNYSIPDHISYSKAGEIFCNAFNVNVKKSTREPYKAFSSGNSVIINDIKREFRIRL